MSNQGSLVGAGALLIFCAATRLALSPAAVSASSSISCDLRETRTWIFYTCLAFDSKFLATYLAIYNHKNVTSFHQFHGHNLVSRKMSSHFPPGWQNFSCCAIYHEHVQTCVIKNTVYLLSNAWEKRIISGVTKNFSGMEARRVRSITQPHQRVRGGLRPGTVA